MEVGDDNMGFIIVLLRTYKQYASIWVIVDWMNKSMIFDIFIHLRAIYYPHHNVVKELI